MAAEPVITAQLEDFALIYCFAKRAAVLPQASMRMAPRSLRAQAPQPCGRGKQRFLALGKTKANHVVVGTVLIKSR